MRINRDGMRSYGTVSVNPKRNPGGHDLEELFSELSYNSGEGLPRIGGFKLKSSQAEDRFRELIRQDELASASFIFIVNIHNGPTEYLHSKMRTSDQFEYQWTDRLK